MSLERIIITYYDLNKDELWRSIKAAGTKPLIFVSTEGVHYCIAEVRATCYYEARYLQIPK